MLSKTVGTSLVPSFGILYFIFVKQLKSVAVTDVRANRHSPQNVLKNYIKRLNNYVMFTILHCYTIAIEYLFVVLRIEVLTSSTLPTL